ncbi:hypothetical protein QTP86_026965, partial [Hemibagrus guttatus]
MEKPCTEGIYEDGDEEEEFPHPIPWQKIEAQELDCDYGLLFSKEVANRLFMQLEEEVEYFTGDEAKVQVYGKMYSVPRKQATYGDEGLVYSFSGVHLAARLWTPTLEYIRDAVTNATGYNFNFVLINRLQGEEVKKVQEFMYLWSTVQSNGECGKEVKKRVQAGWNGWRKVSGVLCDQKISARIKGKVYRTVVRPAMLYGLETVSLRKRQESELEVAELKMLRYKDGQDHIGEHRDDEHELDPSCPIAAVSLGAVRDLVFRHRDARKEPKKHPIEPVKLELAHGSLLLMNSPTNTYWYHSLPVRKRVKTPRISLTFRRIIKGRQKRKK